MVIMLMTTHRGSANAADLQGVNEIGLRGVRHQGSLHEGAPLLLQALAEGRRERARICNAAGCHHHITHHVLHVLLTTRKSVPYVLRLQYKNSVLSITGISIEACVTVSALVMSNISITVQDLCTDDSGHTVQMPLCVQRSHHSQLLHSALPAGLLPAQATNQLLSPSQLDSAVRHLLGQALLLGSGLCILGFKAADVGFHCLHKHFDLRAFL